MRDIAEQLEKLIERGEEIISQPKRIKQSGHVFDVVDHEKSISWGVTTLTLLSSIFQKNSDLYQKATKYFENLSHLGAALSIQGVLRAALDCWNNNYHLDIKEAVASEVFSDFFEMAESMLGKPYHPATAASLVGGVLEEHLRGMCKRREIPVKKDSGKEKSLGSLNEDLSKAGAYNAVKKKQIEAWTNLRNDAAHGKFEQVEEDDVRRMLEGVKSFCADVS
jgi:hypothetical protein